MIKKILAFFTFLIFFTIPVFAFEMPLDSIGITGLGETPEMQQYSVAVGKKIISNFDMPNTNANLATMVIFKVDKSGKLTSYEITQSSGDKDYDNRVINAIKKSSPYPAPNFDEATDVGVLLNMDLGIIKMIKMLSNMDSDIMNLDIEDLFQFDNLYEMEQKQPSGKKFVNPYKLEKSLE